MENKGFRCPNCGQAEEMHVETNVFTMDEEMKVFSLNGAEIPGVAYINGNPDITCHKCEAVHKSEIWFDAFHNADRYFDMDSLCRCGGELWMDLVEGTRQYAFICEKCKWIKPNVHVSGL